MVCIAGVRRYEYFPTSFRKLYRSLDWKNGFFCTWCCIWYATKITRYSSKIVCIKPLSGSAYHDATLAAWSIYHSFRCAAAYSSAIGAAGNYWCMWTYLYLFDWGVTLLRKAWSERKASIRTRDQSCHLFDCMHYHTDRRTREWRNRQHGLRTILILIFQSRRIVLVLNRSQLQQSHVSIGPTLRPEGNYSSSSEFNQISAALNLFCNSCLLCDLLFLHLSYYCCSQTCIRCQDSNEEAKE